MTSTLNQSATNENLAPAVDHSSSNRARFVPTTTPDALARAAATKRRRSALMNVSRVHLRRRRPGEVPTATWAIANHCAECCGWVADGLGSVAANVEACPARECWLYVWRTRKLNVAAVEAEKRTQ